MESSLYIGSPSGVFGQIRRDLGPSYKFNGVRQYANGGALGNDSAVNHFPASWPDNGSGSKTLLSIYPNLNDLLSGKLDAQIRDLISTAPVGSMLNAWHEVLSLPYTESYLTANNIYQMHSRLNALCSGSNVLYGCLLGGGDLNHLMSNVPPNLGYYGIDTYGNIGINHTPRWDTQIARWQKFRDLAKAKDKVSGYPWLVIGETNCPNQSLRPDWLKYVASWMHDYGPHARAMLTFWSPTGNLSGPWDSSDAATITALRDICTRYGA